MPSGVYKRSEKQKKNLRERNIGKHNSINTEFKKGFHISSTTEFKKNNHASLNTEFKKGLVPWNKGKSHLVGFKNPNWKGGVSLLRERLRKNFQYRQWRSDVFTRDNFTCQECNSKNIFIEAHHIKPFSKIREENNITTIEQALDCEELWDIKNGVTLCKKCHKKINRQQLMGNKNAIRDNAFVKIRTWESRGNVKAFVDPFK